MSELQEAARAAAAAFQRVGWSWDLPTNHVPGVAEIKQQFINYLREAYRDGKTTVECGRLKVERCPGYRQDFELYLNLGSIWQEDLPSVLTELEAIRGE